MNFRGRKFYWLSLSFKLILLTSISIFSFFPEFGLTSETKLCIVDNDVTESLDFEEQLEVFDLDIFCFEFENFDIHCFDQKYVTSKLNLNFPSGFTEIQLLPPETI